MRYFLKIEDCDESGAPCGKALPVIAEGKFEGGVLTLEYIFDNAHYKLQVSANRIYHVRYGDTNMKLEFCQGELTDCTLGGEGLDGDFGIYTHELHIMLTPNGCSAQMKFSESAEDERFIHKKITAYKVK